MQSGEKARDVIGDVEMQNNVTGLYFCFGGLCTEKMTGFLNEWGVVDEVVDAWLEVVCGVAQ